MSPRALSLLPVILLAACGGEGPDNVQFGSLSSSSRSVAAGSTQVGSNVVTVPYQRSAYLVIASGDGSVVRLIDDPSDKGAFVPATAIIRFSDTSLIPFTEKGNAGPAYRLYKAAFTRTPDLDGLHYWMEQLNGGVSLLDVANGFAQSAEFKQLYGSGTRDPMVITHLYRNVLGREPEAAGLNYRTDIYVSGRAGLADILMAFSESQENKSSVAAQVANGIAFKETGVTYSGGTAPQATLPLAVSGQRYVGSTLTFKPDGSPTSAQATYAWSLMSVPAGSSAKIVDGTALATLVPDLPGSYQVGVVITDGSKKANGSVQVTVTEQRMVNTPYLARNGMTVTLESLVVAARGSNYVDYTVTYVQSNRTELAIEEGMLKLYFQKEAALPQYGFFNKIYPGEQLRRSHTFTQVKGEAPTVLEYDSDNFFRASPAPSSLQWPVPLN